MKQDDSLSGGRAGSGVVRMVVRTTKEDSAFFYAVLEASEGLASYSTVKHQPGNPNRDVELLIPLQLVNDVKNLLEQMKDIVEILEG